MKIKTLITFLLLLSFSLLVVPWDSVTDTEKLKSLKSQLESAASGEKAKIYNDLAYRYCLHPTQVEEIRKFAEKAINLSQKYSNCKENVRANLFMGFYYARVNRFLEGEKWLNRGLKLAKNSKDKGVVYYSYHVISDFYIQQSMWDKAIEMTNQALTIAQDLKYKMGIAGEYHSLSRLNLFKNQYKNSLAYIVEAEKIYRELKKWNSVIDAQIEKAQVESHMAQNYSAIKSILGALDLTRKHKYDFKVGYLHMWCGRIYNNLGEEERIYL